MINVHKKRGRLEKMKLVCREGTIRLTTKNFVYAESELHYVGIWVLKDGALQKYSLRVTLDNLEKQITLPNIWRIHKSYLVNATYVKKLRRYEIELITGRNLSVSQAKYDLVQQKYTEYIENRE